MTKENNTNSADAEAHDEGTPPPSTTGADYETVESAAARLTLEPAALRARLRRAWKRQGRPNVVALGSGIRAIKIGRTWRVHVPRVAA